MTSTLRISKTLSMPTTPPGGLSTKLKLPSKRLLMPGEMVTPPTPELSFHTPFFERRFKK
jgi:hypothetical protein